jgi:putative hydrolase of the HAD superfamily
VPATLEQLSAAGVRLGLISNSQRCLKTFQAYFSLNGLIDATVSSSEHGLMKPHPSIFKEALWRAGVAADEALMVGDSVRQDVDGARKVGMRAVLLHRCEQPHPRAGELEQRGVVTIRTLYDLPQVLNELKAA